LFVALVAVAGFLLGLRAGIELGYRRAMRRAAMALPERTEK